MRSISFLPPTLGTFFYLLDTLLTRSLHCLELVRPQIRYTMFFHFGCRPANCSCGGRSALEPPPLVHTHTSMLEPSLSSVFGIPRIFMHSNVSTSSSIVRSSLNAPPSLPSFNLIFFRFVFEYSWVHICLYILTKTVCITV